MKREELEHILRAASRIAGDSDVLVLGSQSILGTFTEDDLPERAHASIEADVTFFDDYDNTKSDAVDMHLGEDSQFHQTFGYYAQGVDVGVATLPSGWQDRMVVLASAATDGASGHCRADEGHGVRRRPSSCRTHRRGPPDRQSADVGGSRRSEQGCGLGHRMAQEVAHDAWVGPEGLVRVTSLVPSR